MKRVKIHHTRIIHLLVLPNDININRFERDFLQAMNNLAWFNSIVTSIESLNVLVTTPSTYCRGNVFSLLILVIESWTNDFGIFCPLSRGLA